MWRCSAKKTATPPPPSLVISLSVRRDQNDLQYDKRRKDRTGPAPHLDNLTTKKREQFALFGIASGLQQADTIGTLPVLSLDKSAPNEPNDSTHLTHKIMRMLLISWGIAGLFGVAFVQTALQSPLQQNSGTQQFVRVVR